MSFLRLPGAAFMQSLMELSTVDCAAADVSPEGLEPKSVAGTKMRVNTTEPLSDIPRDQRIYIYLTKLSSPRINLLLLLSRSVAL